MVDALVKETGQHSRKLPIRQDSDGLLQVHIDPEEGESRPGGGKEQAILKVPGPMPPYPPRAAVPFLLSAGARQTA